MVVSLIFILVLYTMDIGPVFILTLYTLDLNLIFILIIDYVFWPNFHPNTIYYALPYTLFIK